MPWIYTLAKGGFTVLEENKNRGKIIWLELRDLLAGTAFPFMLMVILSVSFIGMASTLSQDFALSLVLLIIGEILLAVAYVIFGRMSGVTSVRKLVQHAKKRELGTKDLQALYCTGEYSAYKGFLIGFMSCVPYIIIQIIECGVHNSFCYFLLRYIFGWALVFSEFASLSPWLNLIMVLFPTAVHGVAYIVGAHMEWNKQQKVANLQSIQEKKDAE